MYYEKSLFNFTKKMRTFLRIIAFVIIIFALIYFFKPNLIHKDVYDIDTLNASKYIETPSPGKVFLANLKLSSSTTYDYSSLHGWISLYFEAVDIFNVKILDLLENSKNKKITLITYTKQLETIQNKLENAISNIENSRENEEQAYIEYKNKKTIWDSQFLEWFASKDANLSVEWLNTSVKNGPKATKHRILKNAGTIVLTKLKKVKNLVDLKLSILQDNQDTIVNNYLVIKWDLIEKLRKLKYMLDNNIYN